MKSRGFTLVELVITIAIMGILASMVSIFIARPIESYVDTANRAALTDMADLALKRMSLEIRNALPNSIRVASAREIEFIPTTASGRYCTDTDAHCPYPTTTFKPLRFFDQAAPAPTPYEFDFLTIMPSEGDVKDGVDYQLVIFNTGQTDLNAYAGGNRRTARRNGAGSNTLTITGGVFTFPSPTDRFHIVSRPVKFKCEDNGKELRRYTGYDYGGNEAGITGALLLSATLLECRFDYAPVSADNGLLTLEITLHNEGGSITLSNQIHVDNLP